MLKYGGINTKGIPYDANASQIKTRLEELPSISVGSIDVSSGAINPSTGARQWYVTFTGRYGDVAELMEYDDVALRGNGAAVYIRETTKGVESKHISGSPFFINVLPNRAEPSTTIAYGEGLVGAIAGRLGAFTIQAKDVHGNNRIDSQPREVFQVDIFQPGVPPRYPFMTGEKIGAVARRTFINTQQPIHIMGNVSYIGNGDYEVVYYPEVSGRYTIAITIVGSSPRMDASSNAEAFQAIEDVSNSLKEQWKEPPRELFATENESAISCLSLIIAFGDPWWVVVLLVFMCSRWPFTVSLIVTVG